MIYIIIGKKGKTIRYVGSRGAKGLRRLPMAFSSRREAEFTRDRMRKRMNKRGILGWTIRIKRIG